MIKVNNVLAKSSLNSHLKKYKVEIIFSFMIGAFIGISPYVSKAIKNFRIQQLIQEEKLTQIKNKERVCKNKNSDYSKFLSLGFPNTAIEKFNICMNEN